MDRAFIERLTAACNAAVKARKQGRPASQAAAIAWGYMDRREASIRPAVGSLVVSRVRDPVDVRTS